MQTDSAPEVRRDAIVIGGGIGGLASAFALASAGLQITVLERADSFNEIGAGLQLAPNATRILDRWGLLQDIIDLGHLPRRLVLRDADTGRELSALSLGESFVERYGAPYVVLHRSDLLAVLRDACIAKGVHLVPGVQVEQVALVNDVARVLSGSASFSGDIAIAADGLWSSTRRMVSNDEPTCSGYVAYRGTAELETLSNLSASGLDDVVVHVGPGRHLVQYALRRGSVLNTVAVFASAAYARGEQQWGSSEELDEAFSESPASIRDAVRGLWRDRSWPMYDREPIDTWVYGRLALVGDAAHPMLQYLAQGACQAIEDADALQTTFERRGTRRSEWPQALVNYQSLRSDRARRVQTWARKWGDTWHCDGIARALRDELLLQMSPLGSEYLDWLYLGLDAPQRRPPTSAD